MYLLMIRQFFRTTIGRLGLSLGLILGVIGLITGKQFLNRQDKIAQEVIATQDEHIKRNIKFHNDDLGLLLYYLKFTLVNEQNPMAGLSIGQKDLNASVQNVNILTLEGQKYDTDLVNPSKLLHGNLDLSFVLIFIFPLLIIAFTYNLRSEEEENGSWKIVSVMAKSTSQFLLMKLLVRFVVLWILMMFLFLMASLVMSIGWSPEFFLFIIIGTLNLIFWFAFCYFIVVFKRNSNFNALILLASWLVLVVLMPSVVNNYIANQYPIPEAFTTYIKQRDGYHQKWDEEKKGTMEKFYAQYPQLASYGFPEEEGFSWLWYYAMQHLGDAESRQESIAMHRKIEKREIISKQFAQFFPSMHIQLKFNELTGSDLSNYLKFLKHTVSFHEDTRLYFYPKVFSQATAEEVEWEKFKPTYFAGNQESVNWVSMLLPLIIAITTLIGITFLVTKVK